MKNFLKTLLKIVAGIIIGILLSWNFHWFCTDNVIVKEVIKRDTVVTMQIVEKQTKIKVPVLQKPKTDSFVRYVFVDSSKGLVIRDTIFLPRNTVSDSINKIDILRDIKFEKKDSLIYVNQTNTILRKEHKFLIGAGLRLNPIDKVETMISFAHKSKKDKILIVNWHYPINNVLIPAREQFSIQYLMPF
jgi:hypothetical protein